MTINEWPSYVQPNEGCFYWGWFVACEMQLFLITFPLVWLLEIKIGRDSGYGALFLGFLIISSMIINFRILYGNNMSAGLPAPQDKFIYLLWLNKAYTKLGAVAFGFILARLYLNIDKD